MISVLVFTKAEYNKIPIIIYANRTGGPVSISCAVREALAPAVRARFNRPYNLTEIVSYEKELRLNPTSWP